MYKYVVDVTYEVIKPALLEDSKYFKSWEDLYEFIDKITISSYHYHNDADTVNAYAKPETNGYTHININSNFELEKDEIVEIFYDFSDYIQNKLKEYDVEVDFDIEDAYEV